MDVELNQFFARTRAGIGDAGFDRQGVDRARVAVQIVIQVRCAELGLADLSRSKSETGVRLSVAEGKLRGILLIDVARNILGVGIMRRVGEIRAVCRTPGTQCVVVKRLLTDAARPTYYQLTAGIGFTEQRPSERRTGFGSGKPGCQNRGYVVKSPRQCERTAAEENEHNRL